MQTPIRPVKRRDGMVAIIVYVTLLTFVVLLFPKEVSDVMHFLLRYGPVLPIVAAGLSVIACAWALVPLKLDPEYDGWAAANLSLLVCCIAAMAISAVLLVVKDPAGVSRAIG